VLTKAIADSHPGVRRHAVRLSERLLRLWSEGRLAMNRNDALAAALLKIVDDPDDQVRLQLAYTLGQWSDPRAAEALTKLAQKNAGDPYITAAVISSAPRHVAGMLQASLASEQSSPDLAAKLLGLAVAMKNDEAVAVALERIGADASPERRGERFAQLATLLEVLARRNMSLKQFREQSAPRVREALAKCMAVLDEARGAVPDAKAPLQQRVAAVGLLAWDDDHRQADIKVLFELVAPQAVIELQLAAVAGLGRLDDAAVAAELFARWKTLGPRLRSALIDQALSRPRMTHLLLERLQSGKLAVAELEAAARDRLRNHPTPTVRAAAAVLLGKSSPSSRAETIAKYLPTARAGGDATRGLAVHKKLCANCHRLGDVGIAVGPDLATMADRSPETILTAVLDPNRAVETRYQGYSALLTDGRTLTGMLAAETGGGITLLAAEGKKHEIARADIERLESSGKSLMPEGIEKDLSPQDLADVIAYLGKHRAPRRQFAGNEPQVVAPAGASDAAPGSLHLTAAVAEIYGQQIVFEPQYKNLGYWSGPQDHALWRLDLPKAGKYEVWLDWACEKNSAGNPYVLQGGEQTITGRVESTGRWETYRRAKIGALELTAGKHEVIFRPGDGFKGTLIDLREVHLVPAGSGEKK
jgi:putative heme-binding domain-containing protein